MWIGVENVKEVWIGVERKGEVWRGVERCGEVWRGLEKCGEMDWYLPRLDSAAWLMSMRTDSSIAFTPSNTHAGRARVDGVPLSRHRHHC